MADFTEFLQVIKEASNKATDNTKPVTVVFGTVISESPLQVQIDQRLVLGEMQLVLTRNVTDYYTDETVDHLTENRGGGAGYSAYESHNHNYKGRKQFLIHHKLLTGDKVVLLRQQGGQKYIILDRVVMI